jgi:hypothetical protein
VNENWGLIKFLEIAVADWLKLTIVWLLLYLFQLLSKLLPVGGFAGRWIEYIHEFGSIAVVLLLISFLLIDVFQALR